MSATSSTSEPAPADEHSAEILRLTLPLLAQHASDFGPHSYALWYHYAAGTTPSLTEALAPQVTSGHRLTPTQTAQFYESLLCAPDFGAMSQMRDEFVELLHRTSATTAAGRERAAHFGQAVAQECAYIADHRSGPSSGLGRLLDHGVDFSRSLSELSAQLQQSETEIDRLRDQLQVARNEAHRDALTGLQNRRSFDDRLVQMLAEANNPAKTFCLIMVDVDHFKAVNDQWGHVFGDRVLRAIAETLTRHVKGLDVVARFGGEEFAVLLPGTRLASALIVAEQLRSAVNALRVRRQSAESEITRIAVSCGVTQYLAGDSPTHLIERADKALYQAKNQGRNRVVASA